MLVSGEVDAVAMNEFTGRTAIKTLNRHLENRDWVAAGRATIADISLVGYLFWPDHYGIDWKDYPNIEKWLARIKKLPNFAMPEEILPTS